LAIYAATALGMLAAGYGWASATPFLLIGGPRLYGCWHFMLTVPTQHGGLAENVINHRLNSRTVYMNPVSSFIYWNMNYHAEHHMFPTEPYDNLPKHYELIRHDLPRPNSSIWEAYREMIPAAGQQRRDPDYFVRREPPPTAKPYREGLHNWVPERVTARGPPSARPAQRAARRSPASVGRIAGARSWITIPALSPQTRLP
jgi:fatty acid desaturase